MPSSAVPALPSIGTQAPIAYTSTRSSSQKQEEKAGREKHEDASKQSRKPKKHKASPEVDEGYNSADEYGSIKQPPPNPAPCNDPQEPLNEVDSELQMAEELKKKGYYIKKMMEDGNCLFRSIADQIYGDEEMHGMVRTMCMDYMDKERDHFSQFITEDFESYIVRKREDKCYGNNIEMQALAEVFGRPIEVYYGSNAINIFHGTYSTDNPPIRLSYHHGNHYNSVIDPNNPSVGVGLGLPAYKPGLGDKLQLVEALKLSEEEEIERHFFENSRLSSELAETERDIEEAVLAASRAEYIASLFSNARVPQPCNFSNNNNNNKPPLGSKP